MRDRTYETDYLALHCRSVLKREAPISDVKSIDEVTSGELRSQTSAPFFELFDVF
jgi:hypothetical protein